MSLSDRRSVFTLSWVQFPGGDEDVAALTPAWPLEEVLGAAAAAGFPAVGLDHHSLRAYLHGGRDLDDLAALLASLDLRCSDIGILGVGSDDIDPSELTDIAAATSAPICAAAVFEHLRRSTAIDDLRRASDVLSANGCRLALEFVTSSAVPALADALDVCEEVGWDRCGVLLDAWHFFHSGAPWETLEALSGEQLALVHVCDGAPPSEFPAESRFRRLPPGDGIFDLDRFAATLDSIGYRGSLSVEVLSTELRRLPPRETAALYARKMNDTWPS